MVAAKQMEAVSGNLITALGNTLFEPYGIVDPDVFLTSLGDGDSRSSNILSAKLSSENEDSVVVSMSGKYEMTRKSLVKELKQDYQGEDGWSGWSAKDQDIEVMLEGGLVTVGSPDDLKKIRLYKSGPTSDLLKRISESKAPITTVGADATTTLSLVEMLAHEGHGDTKAVSTYYTETRFTKSGMERKTTSDFGMIGSIIAQLDPE